MEIIRTNKQYQEEQKLKKEIKQQRLFCPCCKSKRNWLVRFIKDNRFGYYSYYYRCECIQCGAKWDTDFFVGVN